MNTLCHAARGGQPRVVDWLLSVDLQSQFSKEDALCAAAECGSLETVKVLLGEVENINSYNQLHGTALQAACRGGHENVVKLLLASGATVDQRGGPHGLALSAAAIKGHIHIIRLLIEHDATCVDLIDDLGRNALHFSARGGHAAAFKYLLSTCKQLDSVDIKGNSVLHQAASGGSREIVQSLLDCGITFPASPSDIWSPLHWAYRGEFGDVIDLLKSFCSSEDVIETVQPPCLWIPFSVGVYHKNRICSPKSKTSTQDSGLQSTIVETTENIISNTEAECHGHFTCNECYHVSLL